MFFDNVSFLCCVLNNASDIISNLQRFIKFMLNTKSVIKYFKAWHPYGLSKSRIYAKLMGRSTEMSSFGMARCLKIYLFF